MVLGAQWPLEVVMRKMFLGIGTFLVALVLLGFLAVRPALAQGQMCTRVGGDLVVAVGESCAGDAVVIGGDLVVRGTVGGNAVAIGGSVQVSGQVGGDVVSLGGEVQLQDGAQVEGDVAALGGESRRAPGAVVRGNILESGLVVPFAAAQEGRPLLSLGLRILGALLSSGLAFGLCLLVALVLRSLWSQRTAVMVATLRRELATSAGMGLVSGLLLVVGVPIATIVLAVTVIGLLVIPFLYIAVVIAYMAALTISGLALGEALVARAAWERPPQWLAAALGLGILVPLTLFPGVLVPCVGPFWALLLPSGGLGAIVLSRLGTLCRPGVNP
jgi:hypothetical protein